MHQPPTDIAALQAALDLDNPDGPTVARWRDNYLERNCDAHLVDMCLEHLYLHQLCYSCGRPGRSLVLDEYPWVCADCESRA